MFVAEINKNQQEKKFTEMKTLTLDMMKKHDQNRKKARSGEEMKRRVEVSYFFIRLFTETKQ